MRPSGPSQERGHFVVVGGAKGGAERGRPGLPLQLGGGWLLPSAPEIEGLVFQSQQLNTTFPLLSQPQREVNRKAGRAVWPALSL